MHRSGTWTLVATVAGLMLSLPAAAQPTEQEMMEAWTAAMAVGPEHEALTSRAGTWAVTTTFSVMPGSDETMTEHGTVEMVATLDGRVIEEQFAGSMMGTSYSGIGRTGYDNITGRYWTTWNDTMSTGLIVMYGDYDPATSTYTFEGITMDPIAGEIPTRMERTIDGPDRETSVFYFLYPGMTEMAQAMEIVYERQ